MTAKRVQLSTIVKSQVPDYVRSDFPQITEFLKGYYKGQEYQGGPIDLINNIDRYLKIDSFTNRVYSNTISKSINTIDSTIEVIDTSGFPDSYGLLKIDNEIITYKGKTDRSFTGCIRGFSGICELSKNNSPDEVLFESTNAETHANGAQVLNLSVLFLAEFLNKTKKEIATGFDDREFYSEVNQNTFLKQVRSFYASKGTEESFKILFKALYGVKVELVNPADLLFRPSDAQFNQVESIIVDPTTNESEFDDIQNITLFQDYPSKSYAPISYSEKVLGKDSKVYHRLDIDAGYNKDITFDGAIYGDFKVTPKTKLVNPVSIGASYLDVESTVGFANTGHISFKYSDGSSGTLYYGSKTINQFRDAGYIYKQIEEEENITDRDTFAYATINGKTVQCDVSSIISTVNSPSKSLYNIKGSTSRIKTLGFEGSGFKFNDWIYNNKKIFTIGSLSSIDAADKVYRVNLNNNHYIFKDDTIQVIDNSGQSVDGVVLSVINEKSLNIRTNETLSVTGIYTLKKNILKGISPSFPQIVDYQSNIQNVYVNDNNDLLIASSSIPSEAISISDIDLKINGTFEGTEVTFDSEHKLRTGDKVYYYPEITEEKVIDENFNYVTQEVEGSKLFNEGIYYVERINEFTVKFALSKENIFFEKYVTFAQNTVKNNKVRLHEFHEKNLLDQKLLREIPLPLESSSEKVKTLPGMTGILLNGVEILNYKSKNNIYYGEIKSIDVNSSDNQFNIINPPNLVIEDNGRGKNASGFLGVTGSLSKVKIVNRGFDYEGTPTIKIVGGNGSGASVLVNMKSTDNAANFDSKFIQLDPINSIGFSTYHKFRDYEEVVYQTSDQLGITGLTTNTTYFVGLIDRTITYSVTVANKTSSHPYFGQGSGNGYYIIGGDYDTTSESPNLQFIHGETYIFNQNNASSASHAIYFSTVEGSYGGNDRYETGVTYTLDGVNVTYSAYASGFAAASNRSISITVDDTAPSTLYYACQQHEKMGNAIGIFDVDGKKDLNNLKLYNTRNDAVSGINTVSLTVYGNGVHSLTALTKKRQIDSINIIEPGEGYSNKKVICQHTGINTATNSVNSINHGYTNGDRIQYMGVASGTDTQLAGLSLNTDYIATVLDKDSFTLSEIGVGNTINIFADRQEYVNISTTGIGTHIFNHPPIQVILTGQTAIGTEFVAELQPQFLGSINNIHISNGGVGYGVTNIQDFERTPIITYSIGQGTQINAIINNGSITEAIVLNRGNNFTSAPDIVVDGDGTGAVLTSIIRSDGRIEKIIVVEGGRGYNSLNTNIRAVSSESLSQSKFKANLQSWKINLFEDLLDKLEKDDGILTLSSFGNFGIQYSHLFAPRYLRSKLIPSDSEGSKKYGTSDLPFNRVEIDSPNHSPIIGWSYDGNPIYGPYGYSANSGGVAVRMKSGYYNEVSLKSNRPPNYPAGYFIEDYTYYRVDDDSVLDENNGRYCVTPEFPNGTYAYFTTISELSDDSGPFRDYRRPVFPYLIGDNYFSVPSKFNTEKNSNQDGFDLNNSDYKRNTTIYNFFDKDVRYPYINLPNDLDQKVTIKNISKGKVSNIKVLSGGNSYKVGDRLVFDQTENTGNGVAAKVSFVEGKEISKIENEHSETLIEILSSGKKGIFVGVASTAHGYFNGELISLTNFSTTRSKLEGNYSVVVPATTLTLIGLGTTAHALGPVSNTGIVTFVHVSNSNFDRINENDVIQIHQERVKVLHVDSLSGRLRIIREFDDTVSGVHTVGVAATIDQRRFEFKSDHDKSFKFKPNKEYYFDPQESVGLSGGYGNPGTGSTISFEVPGAGGTSIYIKPKSIYLRGHDLKTGDAVVYNINNGGGSSIKYEDSTTTSGIGSDLVNGRTYYVAKFDKDFIGISTVKVGIGSTGVFSGIAATTKDIGPVDFINRGTFTYHSFTTQYPKITSDAIKNRVIVSTATTHGLSSDHRILFDVQPKVGKTVVVKYDDFNRNILINPKSFEPTGINTSTGVITIQDHGFSTGDKLIHTSEWSESAYSNNSPYFAVKINNNNFKLSETLYNSKLDQPITVVGVATTAGTLSPVNPTIDTEGYSTLKFDLSDPSLQYEYFSSQYPGFQLDFYIGNTFTKPWTKNPQDSEFKVVKSGIVGSNATVTLFLDSNTPKDLYYNLVPKYTQGVPLSKTKKDVYLDTTVNGAGFIKVSPSSYSGSHKVKVSTASTFTYNLTSEPEVVSYGSTNASLSYITDCTHTDGPISQLEILNTGDNYNTLPGFTTVTSINGVDCDLELQSLDIGLVKNVEITNYGYDFPYDQTIRPLFYYSQSLKITPFSSIDFIGISSFGRGYFGEQQLVVVDAVSEEIVSDIDLEYTSTSAEVTILRNTYGMNNVVPKIYPINSGAGVPIDNSQLSNGIVYDSTSKIATATVATEYSVGDYYPFVIGEKIMIEGSNPGIGNSRGFNSSEFNYDLYTITGITTNFGGGVGSVSFSMAEQLKNTETVIAYDKINSAARLLPQRDFPIFDIKIKKNEFIKDEIIRSNNKTAIVEEWDKEFSILKVNSIDEFEGNENITGQTSKSIGTVGSVLFPFKEYGKYGSTIKQNRGWKAIAGFLNNDLQRIPDNDYYQNFSYSLKSTVPLQIWNDPVSSMNHVAGYKKFANYQLESYEKGLKVSTSPTQGSSYVNLIKDIVETIDINCVNDFDLVRENFISLGDVDLVSTQIIFESRLISSFDQAVSNRVLSIDDISSLFSHRPRSEEFVNIDRFDLDKSRFLRFITLVRDQRFTSERQVSIFDVIHDGTYGYTNEYAINSTISDMGSFDFAIERGEGLIQYFPISDKVAFNDFNVSYLSYKIDDNFVGIGSSSFSDVAIINTSSTELNTVGTGVTIVSIGSTYNSVSVMVTINPDSGEQNEEFQFVQINFVHDGTNIVTSGEFAHLATKFGAVSDPPANTEGSIGYGTFYPYIEGNNFKVEYVPNVGIGTTAVINTIQIGLAQTATSGSTDFNMVHARMQSQSTTIAASASPGITTINDYRYIANSEEFHAAKYYVHIADKTNNRHEFVELFVVDTINGVGISSDIYVTEFSNLGTTSDTLGSYVGLGTFGGAIDDTGFGAELRFTPIPNIDVEVNLLAQQLKSETSDDVDTITNFNNGIITTDRDDYVGTFNAVKTDFDLTHEGQDIFENWFDGGNPGIVSTTDNTIKLPNHFFVSGERVSYYRNDVNDPSSAIGVGETFITGIGLTTILPNDIENLFMVKIDDTFVGLATSPADAQLANPNLINITSVGSGTSHRFLTTKQNSRVLVTIDNIIQSPVVSTAITSSLNATALSTTDIIEFVGVTSFFGGDFVQINNEIMKISGVGANNTSNKVRVRRARLGTKFANHAAGDIITKISGNYNIIDSTISFAEPPYGPDPVSDPSDPNSIDWEGIAKGSSFHGRSYMRGKVSTGTSETYRRNTVFQDVSDKFNALENTFPLKTTDGQDIADIANENAIILINSVFQLPGITVEEDYRMIEYTAGITSAVFNGDARDIGYDVGISSFPAAGIIQSIGSTEGFGYQPLVSAAGTVTVSASGAVTSVSVGFTGSGYRSQEYHEIITKTNHLVSAGTTEIFIDNLNSVFGILSEVYNGTNAYIGIGTFRAQYATILNGIGNTFIELTSTQTSVYDIPSGTQVSIGVTLPYGIVNVSAATSSISPGVVSGLTYDVLGADYNPETGFMSMTLPVGHELTQGDYIIIKDKSLNFSCTSDNNTRVKSYPRPNLDTNAWNRPIRLEDVVDQSVKAFVGLSTFAYFNVTDATYTAATGDLELTIGSHNLVADRGISIETDSLSFKCAMDGNTATKTYPRATDPAANTTLDITAVTSNTITVNVGASPLVTYTPGAGTTYDPSTGLMVLEIGTHNLTAGTSIKLATESLTFSCGYGGATGPAAEKSYPRSNGNDPFYDTAINIASVTETTITLQVLTTIPSTNTDVHTFVSATTGAVISGGNYLHSFQGPALNAVRAGGQYTHTFVSADAGAVVSTATTSIQHIGFATVIIGTGHISPNVTITNPGYDLDIDQELMPQIIFDDPEPYGNIPLIFSNDNTVVSLGTEARVDVLVSNGSSVSSFNFTNSGYAYGDNNILTVQTGGLAGIPTLSNFSEFQINVQKTFDDTFNGWNVGELELLDNVDAYINGRRKLFPLFRDGKRLSIIASKDSKIDPNQLLLVFLNNILQVPKKSYFFFGGNRIRFTEAPRVGDFLRILFYKGNGETDVIETEVIQTVKEGDTLNINSNDVILDENKRTVTDVVSTDTVETLPYFGPGNSADIDLVRPVDWCRQSEDKIINGLPISKARTFYEPNIIPYAYLIKPVGLGDTVFSVNTTRPLFNQSDEFTTVQGQLAQNVIKIHPQREISPSTATATVSIAGTVSSILITDGGHGYLTVPTVSIASTNGVGIGTSGTASAAATLTNGVVTGITITNGGVGYSTVTAPKVLISPAQASKLEQCEVYFPDGYRGDSGTVVGFATTSISGETFALFDLFIPAQDQVFDNIKYVGFAITTSQIEQGDAFTIYNSNVGTANTSITSYDGAGGVLGISTSYIDGVYEVIEVVKEPRNMGGIGTATARVRARVDNPPVGFDFDANWTGSTGMTTSHYQGSYSWGRIVVKSRAISTTYNPYNSQGISGITTSPLVVRERSLAFVGYTTTT